MPSGWNRKRWVRPCSRHIRTHQSRRNHTPDSRLGAKKALNSLGIELREHRNGLRVRILAAGGQVTEG